LQSVQQNDRCFPDRGLPQIIQLDILFITILYHRSLPEGHFFAIIDTLFGGL